MTTPPTRSTRPSHRAYTHRTVLAEDVGDAAREAADVLSTAWDEGREPLVAVLRPPVEDMVRARLTPEAEAAVTFLTAAPGRSPGGAARDHLEARDAGRGPRPSVVTDLSPDSDPYGSDCLESEVLADRDVGDHDEEHTCIYPLAEPFARIARISHPLLRRDGTDHVNPDFRGAALAREEPALAHLNPHVTVRDVVPHIDPDLRAWLAEQAKAAGLDPETVDQVVLATHEALRTGAESRVPAGSAPARPTNPLATTGITTNGVLATRLYLRREAPTTSGPTTSGPATSGPAADPGGLVVDVDAAWLPALDVGRLPDDRRLAGLWFARTACRRLDVTVHPLTPDRSRIRITARTDPH